MSLSREELRTYALNFVELGEEPDVLRLDCDLNVYLLDHCEITFSNVNPFFCYVNCGGILNEVFFRRKASSRAQIDCSGFGEGQNVLAYTGDTDFGHTTAQWDTVLSLGFAGLRERIVRYAAQNGTDPQKQRFYTQVLRVYDAMLRFLCRAAGEAAAAGYPEMARGLENLSRQAPQTLFEAMQVSIGYYVFQHLVEGTNLRTLGRLDSLFAPFAARETEETTRGFLLAYLKAIDSLQAPANIPFAIGGSDLQGHTLINPLSYMILDAYRKAGTNNTKFHILCAPDTPQNLIEQAFCAIREGNNSFVFMSDPKIIEALEKSGAEHADAVDYHIVGCYESGAAGELPCTCSTRVSIVKALEFALNGGRDALTGQLIGLPNTGSFDSFEALYTEFARQLAYLCDCGIRITCFHEAQNRFFHAAPILSGHYTSSLEKGADLYCGNGAKYNNSSVVALGLATAVDSLAAIRKLVYEDQTLTLSRLQQILRENWKDAEPLRQQILHKFPKYGMGDSRTDALAADVVKLLSDNVNGKPDGRGGVFRLGLISIDWRWEFGKKTGATADGRLAGQTISQNISANFGADRNGATAHLLSTARIDYSDVADGTVVDIDLHSSAIRGENGIRAAVSTLKTYFDMGGLAVHYNVLDTEVLKDAKVHPEKYPNLQVRLCGWNVLFSSLSEKEQDEFIARSVK